MDWHMYKHYAQKNENNIITLFFSDGFRNPDDNSVLIQESNSRHFHKSATDEYGYIYKADGDTYTERTDDDRIEEYRQSIGG